MVRDLSDSGAEGKVDGLPVLLKADSSAAFEGLYKKQCGVEQLVARRAHNPKVVSSSLAPAT